MLGFIAILGSFSSCINKQDRSSPKIAFGLEPETNPAAAQNSWIVNIFSIFYDNTLSYCTGSLISPNLILTAQHCFKKKTNANLFGRSVTFRFGTNNLSEHRIHESNVHLFNGYEPFSKSGKNYSKNDLALVQLSEPVDEALKQNLPEVILKLIDFDSHVSYGRGSIMFFGYGDDQSGNATNRLLFGEAIPRSLAGCSPTLYKNEPGEEASFCWSGSAPSASLRLGDSGGPVTVFKDGKHYLVGVSVSTNNKDKARFVNIANKLTDENFVKFFDEVKNKADLALLKPKRQPCAIH
jgi:hypothetical protein